MMFRTANLRRVTRRERGEVSFSLFQLFEKSSLIFGKKCPNYGHLWAKFLIYSVIFKSFQEKKPEIFFSVGPFFLVL